MENEIIEFEQMNVNLRDLNTSVIKVPKLQETSTFQLLNCFLKKTFYDRICNGELKQEITAVLFRRVFFTSLYSCFIINMLNSTYKITKKIFEQIQRLRLQFYINFNYRNDCKVDWN